MLCELARKKQAHRRLDFTGRKGGLLVVARKTRRLQSQTLKDVVDEGVQDGHAALGDAGLGMDLLQDLVDVRAVGLNSLGVAFATTDLLD